MVKIIISILLLFSLQSRAQSPAAMWHMNNYTKNSFVGILDTYPGSVAAYSLRRLSGSYDGPCLQVKNVTTGGTTQDIYFTSTGFIDTAAIKTFLGTTNTGIVYKWYDQSGNGNDLTDLTYVSGSNGMWIDSLGTLIKMNGVVAIKSFVSGHYFTSASNITVVNSFAVAKVDALTSANILGGHESPPALNELFLGALSFSSQQGQGAYDGSVFRKITSDFNKNLYYWNIQSSAIYLAKNGAAATNAGSFSSSILVNEVLGRTGSNQFLDGRVQELIFYSSEQSANKSGIESNINSFWSIY